MATIMISVHLKRLIHRIAMSFLVAGMRSKDGIIVKNCKNIETSFPDFTNTMNALGMKIHG